MSSGTVFNIQRYSLNDGPGIRTCVFLKGCPINCLWCHNPESKILKPELSFSNDRCTGCGNCVIVCKRKCHSFVNGHHILNRSLCLSCGLCADVCTGALELIGKKMTVSDVIREVCKDMPFYEQSGGGVTFTGGEPFFQPGFLTELLIASKEHELNVCVETCGFVSRDILRKAMKYIDLFLFDIKETDGEKHLQYTGVDNKLILDNLGFLADNKKQIVLRCPIIPGYNDRENHLSSIAGLANKYNSVIRIDIEPYHPLGKTKAAQLGKQYPLGELEMPDKITIDNWLEVVRAQTKCEVRKG